MPHKEALGGQVAPHGGLGVFFLLFVAYALGNLRQLTAIHATFVVKDDMVKADVLHAMPGQAGDAAPHAAGIAYLNVAEGDAANMSHAVYGDEAVEIVTGQQISAASVAQADEDGRLGALHGEMVEADVFHDAAIDDFERDGRRANPLAEEFLALVGAGLHHDVRDADVAEAAVGLGAQLHGVAMARHHAVGNADVLAKARRRALQRDGIVVAVGPQVADQHVVAAVEVEGVVVVVVAVFHLDAVDAQAVAGQVMLHPATAVSQRNILYHNVLAIDKP